MAPQQAPRRHAVVSWNDIHHSLPHYASSSGVVRLHSPDGSPNRFSDDESEWRLWIATKAPIIPEVQQWLKENVLSVAERPNAAEAVSMVPVRSESTSIWFLRTTVLLIPEFLRSLRDDVFPTYAQLHAQLLPTAESVEPSLLSWRNGRAFRTITWQDVLVLLGHKI